MKMIDPRKNANAAILQLQKIVSELIKPKTRTIMKPELMTLQEAIELCKENGGRVISKNGIFNMSREELDEMTFSADEILLEWVYEPPKQSAFQEWSQHLDKYPRDSENLKKEGWNACAYEVLKLKRNPARDLNDINEIHPAVWCHQIEELKEP